MLTVVLPALNEETRIRAAVLSVIQAAETTQTQIEIIIVDDGSTDGTPAVLEALKKEYPLIQTLRHDKNLGFGASFRDALKIAQYDRISLFPGDNAIAVATMKNLFSHAQVADVLIAYFTNTQVRTPFRSGLSRLFNQAYCTVFGVQVSYLQGSPIFPTQKLRQLELHSTGYGILSEINVKLLRQGLSYAEVPGSFNLDNHKSSAIRLKTLKLVIRDFLKLVVDVKILNRKHYRQEPKRVDFELNS